MRREAQKENIMSSQNESMLVSERKPIEMHIKQNIKCECSGLLKNIEAKFQLFELRLQQISANVNICFTKHLQCYGKLVDEQKKRENSQYVLWEMKQVNQAVQDKINLQMLKQQQSHAHLNEEVQTWTRILRDMKTWKSSYTSWSSNLEKNLYDSFKTYRQENDDKLKKMYEAVQEIGLLQRKMLQKTESGPQFYQQQKKSRAMSYNERQSIPSKKSSGPNESTMIYSRQCGK